MQEGVTVAYSASSDSLFTYIDSYAGTNGYIQDLIISKAEEAYDLSDQQAQIQTRLDKIENKSILMNSFEESCETLALCLNVEEL